MASKQGERQRGRQEVKGDITELKGTSKDSGGGNSLGLFLWCVSLNSSWPGTPAGRGSSTDAAGPVVVQTRPARSQVSPGWPEGVLK